MTGEQNILVALTRIERKLDDIERKIKSIEQDTARVRRAVKA